MNVLITGSKGFVGKRLWKQLSYNPKYNLFSQFGSKEYDLTYEEDVQYLFSIFKPDIVIHLAARVGGIGANQNHPGSFFYDNIKMGINVIEECRLNNVKKVIYISTTCEYPKFTPIPFKEIDLYDGYPEETNAYYGYAKKSLRIMLDGYYKQYGLNSVSLVPANLFGPGDNFDPNYSHVIPAIILKVYQAIINESSHITIWGTGSATREFLYVDDLVNAICLAIEKDLEPQPINIGNGQEISIKDLVYIICKKMNYHGDIVYDKTKPDGQPRRCLDITKAKNLLEYEPKTPLNAGLDYTIEWFLQNVEKMNDYLSYI